MTLNPFSSLQPPDSGSEQIVQAKPAALDEAVEKAYRLYTGRDHNPFYKDFFYVDYVYSLEKQILSPSQIDSLLKRIISETEPEKLNDDITGYYLSRLMQDSYNAGNNDFVLTTGDTNIGNLGYFIIGTKGNKLRLQIDGNVGDTFGYAAEHSEITISGNAGNYCVEQAINSEITILGNVGYWSGARAENTRFTVHNEQAYDVFKIHMDNVRGNRLRLVNSKGKIIRRLPKWPPIHF